MKATIPILDLNDYQSPSEETRQRFISGVGEALRDVGFFGLLNHGLTKELTTAGYNLSQEFFRLPPDTKNAYNIKGLKGQRGFVPFGAEKAKDAHVSDLKEFWHVGQLDNQGTPYPDNLWPREVPGFEEVFTKLYRSLEHCAHQILECCGLYIGEDKNLIADYMRQGNSILRLLHYPEIPADANPSAVRAAAHEDINLITFLVDATTSGLEILGRDGAWIPVVTPEDCVIVDSGDMLANMTNDFYKATTHRVVNPSNSKEARYSMPFFVHPRDECSLNPLPSCIALTGGTKIHKDITAGAYLQQRLEELGLKSM